jgi:hypothetical protein
VFKVENPLHKGEELNSLSLWDDCMDAGGRVTLGAVAERARVRAL